jgi:ABC-2 type transport system ATP-binding protein
MLLGMIAPTSGECYIQGQKVTRRNINIWHDVGYIVETPYSYPDLTVFHGLFPPLQAACGLSSLIFYVIEL